MVRAAICSVIFLLHIVTPNVQASDRCPEASFSNSPALSGMDGADNLTSYFHKLLEIKVIDEVGLNHLIDNLKGGVLVNPISDEKANVNSEARVHYEKIELLLDQGDLDPTKILIWAREYQKEYHKANDQRRLVLQGTIGTELKIEFYPIPSGNLVRHLGDQSYTVSLVDFELMSTPVTRKQWQDVMKDDLSDSDIEDHQDSTPKLDKADFDYPKEKVSWWSALEFANRLSIKHGFKPVYDLSDMEWEPGTNAVEGTLEAKSGKIKLNAANGDYYEAEGYRLPMSDEQIYARGFAQAPGGGKLSEADKSELGSYAWHRDAGFPWIGGLGVLRVGELIPLTVNGNEIYDLFGNIWEWGWDLRDYTVRERVTTTVPPERQLNSLHSDRTGCSIGGDSIASFLGKKQLHGMHLRQNVGCSGIGFRLVRSINPEAR